MRTRSFSGKLLLAVRDVDRAIGQVRQCLAENADALSHFLHPDEIAVVAVSDRADGNVEIVSLVVEVGIRFAHIVLNAGTAKVRAAQSPGDGVFLRDDTDVLESGRERSCSGSGACRPRRGRSEKLVAEFGREAVGEIRQEGRGSDRRRGCSWS